MGKEMIDAGMSITQIVVASVALICLVLFAIWGVAMAALKGVATANTSQELKNLKDAWKNYCEDGNALPMMIIFLTLYMMVFAVIPELRPKMFTWGVFGFVIAIGVLGSFIKADKTNPFKWKFAKMAVVFTFVLIIWTCFFGEKYNPVLFGNKKWVDVSPRGDKPSAVGSAQASTGRIPAGCENRTVPPEDPEIAQLVRTRFAHHPDVVAVAKLQETGLNHWERDENGAPKKGTILHGKKDSDDIGWAQINRRIHADLIKENSLDIEKSLEDYNKFVDILYDKDGIDPWTRRGLCPIEFTLEVVSNNKTPLLKVPSYERGWVSYHVSKGMMAWWNGQPMADGPGIIFNINLRDTKTLQFKLNEGDTTPGTVRVKYTYWLPGDVV